MQIGNCSALLYYSSVGNRLTALGISLPTPGKEKNVVSFFPLKNLNDL